MTTLETFVKLLSDYKEAQTGKASAPDDIAYDVWSDIAHSLYADMSDMVKAATTPVTPITKNVDSIHQDIGMCGTCCRLTVLRKDSEAEYYQAKADLLASRVAITFELLLYSQAYWNGTEVTT